MTSRLTTIKQIAHNIEAHFSNVREHSLYPTLEDDMEDISVAVFNCHPMDEMVCEN